MKKLFTLLTLLVFLGGGKSWGQTEFVLFDGTNAEVSIPATSVQTDATTGFSYQLNGFKTSSLVDVSSFTGTAISAGDYQKGLRYNGGTTSSNNKATITIPEDYIASIDVVYAHNQSSGSYYFGFGTSDGYSKPTGSNCTWNGTASAASTLYKGTISNVASGTYIMGGSADKCLIAYLKVTLTATKTATSEALKSSAAVKVDDTALTLDAGSNGYGVSGNTITLSDDITAIFTPDNVELVKTISYSNSTTEDEDVAVTFDGTVTAGYFIGTATIGLTGSEETYTVRVKQDVTPTLVLSTATGSIDLKSYETTGTAKVTLTGANLANGTFNAPTASGVTVTPETVNITDGTINQEFTITSSETTAAGTVLAFAYTGATTQNYTLNYSKTPQRSVSQSTISAATTWDWTDAGDNSIELNASTSPTNADEFIMAEIAEVENDLEFNSEALKVVCQFPTRGSNHYFQGNSVKFTTSVAGVVKVWFSNTSNRPDTDINRRYLYINGSNTGVYTLNQTFTTASLYVPAGEVVINAYTGEGTPNATMIRIQKIQFDDAALADADAVTVSSAGYATFVLTQDAYFDATDGVTAYAAKANGETIKLTEVKAAPANTPLVIKAAAGTYTLKKATSISPADVSTDINDLVASDGTVVGDGASHYVLGKEGSTVGFGPLASGITLASGKAYIPASKFGSAPSRAFYEIDIDGISTGINMVNGEGLKVNGSETYYDLQGRRVLYPTKGLYIVNGKKVVIK